MSVAKKPGNRGASMTRATHKRPLTVSRAELLKQGDDVEFRSFIHNFLAFSGRVETIRHAFGKLIGLSGVRYSVLISIFHLQGSQGVVIGEVAEHLHLGLATLTVETNKLLELGLINKRNDPEDRRRVLMTLTPLGQRRLERLAPVQQQVNDELFSALSKQEFAQLAQIMERLVPCGDAAAVRVLELTQKDD